jgi:uncharacterized membrane protein YdbT with pleckstrin-like domain
MAKSYLENMLGERERILFVARQHWFILTSAIFLELSAILVTLAATVSLAIFLPVYALLIVAIGFAVLLLPIATMTRDILDWANRQFIVTNRRVIQIAGVINKNVTDSSLEKVNDVKMTQSVLGRTFGYGDIEILTASELGVNLFQRINDPIRFKTAMLNAKEQLEHGEIEAETGDEDIPSLITRLDGLRQQGILSEDEFQAKKSELLNRL